MLQALLCVLLSPLFPHTFCQNPSLQRGLGGPRILVTPYFITWLFEGPSIDSSYETAPERGQGAGGYDFGGGGDWGEGVRVGEGDHQEED